MSSASSELGSDVSCLSKPERAEIIIWRENKSIESKVKIPTIRKAASGVWVGITILQSHSIDFAIASPRTAFKILQILIQFRQ